LYGGEHKCVQGFGEKMRGKRQIENRWEDNIKLDPKWKGVK
jgi:hypothetical protein